MAIVGDSGKPRVLIIGAGSRGVAYASAIARQQKAIVAAVAEPHALKRKEFGQTYIWGEQAATEDQEFCSWEDFVQWESSRRETGGNEDSSYSPIDGVFICTQDASHVAVIQAIAPLGLHIMSEKPLALTLEDCISIHKTLKPSTAPPSTLFSIGHVLRYSPHNILLRKLVLEDQAIGDVVSLSSCEPVGHWHFSHSYVRGNWRRQQDQVGTLLTKSCHGETTYSGMVV